MLRNLAYSKKSASPPLSLFFQWQGASGVWYTHLIYRLTAIPPFRGANYAFVRREPNGCCIPVYFGTVGERANAFVKREKYEIARDLGANEMHIHFTQGGSADRSKIHADLLRGYSMDVNVSTKMAA